MEKRGNMALGKIVYTARATATGGREGTARSDDGKLDVALDLPKAMGGGHNGTNPEQLFAAGYAACFIGAMKFVAGGINTDRIERVEASGATIAVAGAAIYGAKDPAEAARALRLKIKNLG